MHLHAEGWRWSEQLKLYQGVRDRKLRYFTPEGELVPTPDKAADRLAAHLRALGIDPDEG